MSKKYREGEKLYQKKESLKIKSLGGRIEFCIW